MDQTAETGTATLRVQMVDPEIARHLRALKARGWASPSEGARTRSALSHESEPRLASQRPGEHRVDRSAVLAEREAR